MNKTRTINDTEYKILDLDKKINYGIIRINEVELCDVDTKLLQLIIDLQNEVDRLRGNTNGND